MKIYLEYSEEILSSEEAGEPDNDDGSKNKNEHIIFNPLWCYRNPYDNNCSADGDIFEFNIENLPYNKKFNVNFDISKLQKIHLVIIRTIIKNSETSFTLGNWTILGATATRREAVKLALEFSENTISFQEFDRKRKDVSYDTIEIHSLDLED